MEQRIQYLSDMTIVGDALLKITGAHRINYSIFGNGEPALHAHIFPRYMSEPEDKRKGPVYLGYSTEEMQSRPFDATKDRYLMTELATSIRNICSYDPLS